MADGIPRIAAPAMALARTEGGIEQKATKATKGEGERMKDEG
jgi:hypothetical protein